ncbi:MAG: methanogenesis marker 6 protein [Methanoregula sp.]|nr:MAG: methanogenesis marker 6 protein [Methanoregula sp.]
MTEYVPKNPGSVTRYILVESPTLTPAELAIRAYEISEGAMIKETCFGLLINGAEDVVDRLIEKLRAVDPDHIFTKDRGFVPGDPRRCRANLGGARPGFHGIEFETTVLPYVSHGLFELRARDAGGVPAPESTAESKKLDIYTLKKLIEAQEP